MELLFLSLSLSFSLFLTYFFEFLGNKKQMIMRNNIEILNYIKDSTFLQELAEKFFLDLASSIKLIGELFSISNTPNFVSLAQ